MPQRGFQVLLVVARFDPDPGLRLHDAERADPAQAAADVLDQAAFEFAPVEAFQGDFAQAGENDGIVLQIRHGVPPRYGYGRARRCQAVLIARAASLISSVVFDKAKLMRTAPSTVSAS